jgi:predicted Zn-dependent peptidase
MSVELSKLPNGLRVITDTVKSVDSVAVGVWVDVGTRHENLIHNGVAHMVEHMMFKGTAKRTAAQIAEEIEDVGGHVNAYTSREVTAYHIHLLKDHLPLALEILADIIQNSVMPEEEVERERHVILQEIGMSVDTPDDLVFDLYQMTAYPDQGLGAPILGTTDIVSKMPKDILMNYVKEFYIPSKMVVSIAGNVDHEQAVELVSSLFGEGDKKEEETILTANYKGGDLRQEKDLEQSHIILGFQGVSRKHDDFYAALALSTVFGGGMSSRLFQEVREKRGLVYSVFSFHSGYQDDGQFQIYAGTGPKDVPKLMEVLCEEITRIKLHEIEDKEWERCRSQMKASLLMSRESMMSRANRQAKHLIHFGETIDIQKKLSAIDKISKANIQKIAEKIFSSKPTLVGLGPVGEMDKYERVEQKLAS